MYHSSVLGLKHGSRALRRSHREDFWAANFFCWCFPFSNMGFTRLVSQNVLHMPRRLMLGQYVAVGVLETPFFYQTTLVHMHIANWSVYVLICRINSGSMVVVRYCCSSCSAVVYATCLLLQGRSDIHTSCGRLPSRQVFILLSFYPLFSCPQQVVLVLPDNHAAAYVSINFLIALVVQE